jgi:hypothetical protein
VVFVVKRKGFTMAEWEPGDDICPPWHWHWPGPRPPWWDEVLVDVGQQVFVGLTLVNVAGRVADPEISRQVASAGARLVSEHAAKLNEALGR